MFTGAVFFKAVEEGDLFPYGLTSSAWRCRCTSTPLDPGAGREGVAALRHRRRAAGTVLLVNATAIACGSICAPGRNGEPHRDRPRRAVEVEDLRLAYGRARSSTASRSTCAATRSSASSARRSRARPRSCAASTAPSTSPRAPGPGTIRVTARTSGRRATSSRCAARSGWWRRCRSACRCRSTTTWRSRRAAPA
jgi:hypothetical protein